MADGTREDKGLCSTRPAGPRGAAQPRTRQHADGAGTGQGRATPRRRPAGRLPRARRVRTDGDDAFVRDTEPFRREMLADCYRLLGSVDDAEDDAQMEATPVRNWF